ncbi:SapC family protein [Sphingomonas sp. S1-29]|uniref:SapC family protein n=1 Tax=Sphingomonas sp. S1-29 TaxID=2991074 RepID=UPI00223EE900|nr:SapC family protein [Sphingomonas sp. S1-29]UZK70679.1 SapC family protein [Sphingomonas sp. S1-29]
MNRVLLNNVDHHAMKVAILSGAAFGDCANQLPVFPSEFQELQREFAIVFRRNDDGIDAYVLLGLDRDENLFLGEHGWTSRYVPAIQRRGPFSIALARPDPGGAPANTDLMIHVDLDDPRVGDPDGLPLFLDHGGNAPYLDEAGAVLTVIFEGMQTARAINAELEAAGLLKPVTMQIDLDDETQYEVPDLLTVDPQALAELSGDALERLHRSGLLHAATMAACSLGNIPELIARKNRKRAAP